MAIPARETPELLPRQRQDEILARLSEAGAVRVTQLAREFRVTEETIRRDLEKLDRAGKLRRTHGGAVALSDIVHDPPFDERTTAFHEAKMGIARAALAHVEEGDVIALDASSTVHELARALPDMSLTVVTNALPATVLLLDRPQIRLVSTGGHMDAPSRSWVGSFAEATLARLNINKFFMSTKGVDFARGLSEALDDQARVKRAMMDRAETTYLLVDHSKLGATAAVHMADLHEVAAIITDAGAADEHLQRLRALDMLVAVAESRASATGEGKS